MVDILWRNMEQHSNSCVWAITTPFSIISLSSFPIPYLSPSIENENLSKRKILIYILEKKQEVFTIANNENLYEVVN